MRAEQNKFIRYSCFLSLSLSLIFSFILGNDIRGFVERSADYTLSGFVVLHWPTFSFIKER